MPALPLATVFADLPDPRRETKNKLHALADILTIATCGIDERSRVVPTNWSKLITPHSINQ